MKKNNAQTDPNEQIEKKPSKVKKTVTVIGILTGLSLVTTIIANVTNIFANFGGTPESDPTSSVSSSGELVNDGLPLPDDQTEPEAGTTTAESEAASANTATTAGTAAGTSATTSSADSPSSGQTWKVEPLFTVSGYSANYQQELQYDPVNKRLYYHDGVNNKVLRYDFDTKTAETVLEGETNEIIVNPYTGEAYAYSTQYSFRDGYGKMFDLLTGEELHTSFVSRGLFFIEATKLVGTDYNDIAVQQLDTGSTVSSGKRPRTNKSVWRPFLHDDCYYYMSRDLGSTVFYIDKTVQLVTADGSYETVKEYKTTDNISAVHVAEDAVYYITKDNAIYQVNLDSGTGGGNSGPIVVGDSASDSAAKNDILIVDSADIQNTATSYLSGEIKELVKISDTGFAVYDKTDQTVKLISAAS